jgi:hypothetical protein
MFEFVCMRPNCAYSNPSGDRKSVYPDELFPEISPDIAVHDLLQGEHELRYSFRQLVRNGRK